MANEKFVKTITVLAKAAEATPDQIDDLIADWCKYFDLVEVPEKDQWVEFNAIIQRRSAWDNIYLRPPTFRIW